MPSPRRLKNRRKSDSPVGHTPIGRLSDSTIRQIPIGRPGPIPQHASSILRRRRTLDVSNESLATAIATATEAGLVHVGDALAGIRRVRHGTSFTYINANGTPVTSEPVLQRIARLAVPPAYEDVWICSNPSGHLQATGRDIRGRKQYRYHAKWRVARDDTKFGRMVAFGEALPRLRRQLRRDLALRGLPRAKVLAIIVSILDATRVRIGNAEYARSNSSYGLTTLRNRHVQFVRNGRMLLRFRGKGGAEHEIPIDDKNLVRLVRRCHQLPGQHLFQYVDDAGERRPIDSDQVNAYLKDAMGDDFTAKDFRTWGATLQAIIILRSLPLPDPSSERALSACITETIKRVAADLRNTPTVCRKAYINPVVFEAWKTGALHRLTGSSASGSVRQSERPALAFLRRYTRTVQTRPKTKAVAVAAQKPMTRRAAPGKEATSAAAGL
jgi:DNA topoisomerase I